MSGWAQTSLPIVRVESRLHAQVGAARIWLPPRIDIGTKEQPRRCFRKRSGLFLDSRSNLPVVLYRLLSRMLRGIQPTIRLAVSDFHGIWQVTVCRVAKTLNPGTYARRGSNEMWSLKGLSGGVMLRSYVRCYCCRPKRKSQKPAASRRPPVGGEAIERRPASLTFRDCAPESAASTFE